MKVSEIIEFCSERLVIDRKGIYPELTSEQFAQVLEKLNEFFNENFKNDFRNTYNFGKDTEIEFFVVTENGLKKIK